MEAKERLRLLNALELDITALSGPVEEVDDAREIIEKLKADVKEKLEAEAES